jgi:outer membrane lipoprotein carrier protein
VKTAITAACLGLALFPGWLVTRAAAQAASPAESGAASPSLNTIVHRLQRHYQETSSFEAEFKEQIASVGGVKRELTGTIKYRRPGRLRWDFAPPQQETIVADGTTLYVYQPDLSQVIEAPLERAFRTSATAALLLGMGNLERDFVASLPSVPASDHLVHLMLTARSDGTRIALGLDPANYNVVTVGLTDQLGNVTSLAFSVIRTNISLAQTLFTFRVPEGADVVDAPGSP